MESSSDRTTLYLWALESGCAWENHLSKLSSSSFLLLLFRRSGGLSDFLLRLKNYLIRFSAVEDKKPNPKNYSIGITRVPDSYTVQIHARI